MIRIKSASNEKYKLFKSLQQKKGRAASGLFCVEGIKSVNDALASSYEIECIVVSDDFNAVPECAVPVYALSRSLYDKICDTKTPQGITAVLKMRRKAADLKKAAGAYIYCDGVNDPGNIGTIIRCADAAGLNGVITSPGCVDIYAPKTVRASMGSFFNTDIITDKTADDMAEYQKSGFAVIGGALGADSIDFKSADYGKPTIIVVGNEANGISAEILKMCQKVKIPIYGRAESLNVSVAAGILMYEWARNNLT